MSWHFFFLMRQIFPNDFSVTIQAFKNVVIFGASYIIVYFWIFLKNKIDILFHRGFCFLSPVSPPIPHLIFPHYLSIIFNLSYFCLQLFQGILASKLLSSKAVTYFRLCFLWYTSLRRCLCGFCSTLLNPHCISIATAVTGHQLLLK